MDQGSTDANHAAIGIGKARSRGRWLALTVLLLAGCGDPATPVAEPSPTVQACAAPVLPTVTPAPGDHRLSIVHCGVPRAVTLHVPSAYRPGMPLVIVFHQQPGDAETAAKFSGMTALADKEGFLVAYPEGSDRSWNVYDIGPDDSGFIAALLDHAVSTWKADPKRVYATGYSNGAQMSYQVARDLPGRFAAVAPVSGMMRPLKRWKPLLGKENPVSLLTIQGGQDWAKNSWPQTNDGWRQAAECGPETTTATGKQERRESTCGNGGVHVVISDPDLAHEWPDYAAKMVWEFFSRHQAS